MRMHVARAPSRYVDKASNVHRYESAGVPHLPRRQEGPPRDPGNLSKLPPEVIAAIEATLKGQALVPAEAASPSPARCRTGMSRGRCDGPRLGSPGLFGPPCRSRDLVSGLIISRVIRRASELSTLSRWADCTLGPDLGVAGASTDEVMPRWTRSPIARTPSRRSSPPDTWGQRRTQAGWRCSI